MATNTYTALASQTVSTPASSVTISSIPSGYTDLVVIMATTQTAGPVNAKLQFNSDSGTNYSRTWMSGQGTGAYSGRGSNRTSLELDYYTSPGTGSQTIIQIQNYSNTTTYKTALVRTGRAAEGTEAVVGLWRSTAAITSLTFSMDGASNIAAGSTFSLYGIAAVAPLVAKATGGTITYAADGYVYHTFTSSGTFTPTQSLTADVLVIAGGGGGADNIGGGGGAGGFRVLTSQSLSSGTGYTATIGAGGAGGPGGGGQSNGSKGANSSFAGTGLTTITSTGGGYGAIGDVNGGTGGSGGGTRGTVGNGGTGNEGGYSPVEGYNGAKGVGVGYTAGGGGGSSAVGTNGTSVQSGNGGAGVSTYSSWATVTGTGVSGYYAGGGAGGGYPSLTVGPGTGGSGGGGNGGFGTIPGAAGSANTGGGGGGGSSSGGTQYAGGTGGSGLVIVRYLG